MPLRPRALSAALAALLAAAAPLAAQEVRGDLREAGSGRPVAGALVTLLDAAGAAQASALTDSAGRFAVRAPAAGTFRLRAERPGYATATSPALALEAGRTAQQRLTAEPQRMVELEGIQATAARRSCSVRPEAGLATAALWEEARKALSASAHVERAELLRYDVTLFRRRLDAATLQVQHEESERRSRQVKAPFASIPAAELAREGFARQLPDGTYYYAPDAAVLLSDEFLDGHCFVLHDQPPPAAGLVGLAFRPARRGTLTDVAGVLWIDAATSELRFLEYRYTSLPVRVDERRVGGRVEFERLPTGELIVRRWWIRMPAVERNVVTYGMDRERARTEARDSVVWLREEGGEVVATAAQPGRSLASRGRVAGVVFDSIAGRALQDAGVFVSGTQYAARTDAGGAFEIADVPEGEYAVSFTHPRLAATGVTPEARRVSVRPGEEARVDLAIPSLPTLAARLCPQAAPAPARGVVFGTVTRADGAAPVGGAQVTFQWRARGAGSTVEAEANAAGFYVACAVPTDADVQVRVSYGASEGRGTVRLAGAPALRQDLRLGAGPVGVAAVTGAPIPVAGVRGEADAERREANRRLRAGGVLITRADIERRQPQQVTDLFRGIPGVRLVTVPGGYAVEMAGRTTQRFASAPDIPAASHGAGGANDPKAPGRTSTPDRPDQCQGNNAMAPGVRPRGDPCGVLGETNSAREWGQCPMLFFVDDHPVVVPEKTTISAVIHPDEVESIEVYSSGAQVPARYSAREGSDCGVIAIFTRVGNLRNR
ncbi:MAG TPA: carboxypeptidase regulatory-like domain-containing protein [Longimicrobiaceae bacterium]|nr:carboxypeptidase regulatory-like domain-containing protein [Longimicrobiaceae bacterium]